MTARVDRKKAAKAIADLLEAFGLDPADPNLDGTPERVAKAWAEQLIDGQHKNPARALGARFPTTSDGPVVVNDIPFVSMCPHHLLPLSGHAHVGFIPTDRVPGFGAIPRLVDVAAHRLILQEDLSELIVDSLTRAVDARAAVCVLQARHFCVGVNDPGRRDTKFTTVARAGSAEDVAVLMTQLQSGRSR